MQISFKVQLGIVQAAARPEVIGEIILEGFKGFRVMREEEREGRDIY